MLDNVGSIAEVHADADTAYLRIMLRVRGFNEFDERRVIECRNAVRWHLADEGICKHDGDWRVRVPPT